MDRRQFVTGLATLPLALALPAGAVADSKAAVGTLEALAEMRVFLRAGYMEALRGATCLDLSHLDPSDNRVGWRGRVREAAHQLAEFDDGRGLHHDLAMYGQTPAPEA